MPRRHRHRALESSDALRLARLTADAWCTVFTAPKTEATRDGVPVELFYELRDGTPPAAASAYGTVTRERASYGFFHWHLEFPHLFEPLDAPGNEDPTGWTGGFSVMLANPPWDRVKEDPQTWFATRAPDISAAKNSNARNKLIAKLYTASPDSPERQLATEWDAALRRVEAMSNLMRGSGRYPFGGVGEINTYAVFTDLLLHHIGPQGRAGAIVLAGIVTGSTYKDFFAHLVGSRSLATCYTFENEAKLFPDIKNNLNFVLLTLTGRDEPVEQVAFTGFVRQPHEIRDPDRRYHLTPEDIERINPNTLTAPIFRNAYDAEVTAHLHRVAPVLARVEGGGIRNPWGIETMRMFDMANSSHLFVDGSEWAEQGGEALAGGWVRLPSGDRLGPLYEGKMIWQYDHRHGTYQGQTQAQANKGVLPESALSQLQDPAYSVTPRYWIPEAEIESSLESKSWDRTWLLGWRDKTRTDRTFIPCIFPRVGAGHSASILLPDRSATEVACLVANLSTFIVDYAARQKIGNESAAMFVVRQLPVLPPETMRDPVPWHGESVIDFLLPRVAELTYTAHDLRGWAEDLDLGGPPFRFVVHRRELLTAEIEALFCHLYALSRSDAEWIFDSFTTLARYEQRDHGEFRTKRMVLERYDAMTEAIATSSYRCPLDVPPADDAVRHARVAKL
jgi:hypothetical protein